MTTEKMKTTISELSEVLSNWWFSEGEEAQEVYEQTLSPKVRARSSRNGNCHGGWTIVGHPGITRAIRGAGLPHDYYWSGSAPTPSTQAPRVLVDKAYELAGLRQ